MAKAMEMNFRRCRDADDQGPPFNPTQDEIKQVLIPQMTKPDAIILTWTSIAPVHSTVLNRTVLVASGQQNRERQYAFPGVIVGYRPFCNSNKDQLLAGHMKFRLRQLHNAWLRFIFGNTLAKVSKNFAEKVASMDPVPEGAVTVHAEGVSVISETLMFDADPRMAVDHPPSFHEYMHPFRTSVGY